MQTSGLRIGSIRGIQIRVHFTFLLILPFLAFSFARAFQSAARVAGIPAAQIAGTPWMWGLGVAVALFASVLIHELAHSLYGLRAGARISGITLMMIGGVSEVTEMPPRPRDEAIMALLGPLTSLLLGALGYLLRLAVPATAFNLRFALFYLGGLNLFLGLFNLLPAYPMDGGRVLRSILTPRLGPVRATQIAARVGKAFAILFGIWGFHTSNVFLLLIAFFVFIGAQAETRAVVVGALLADLHVRDVMSDRVSAVPAASSVQDAAERMLRERRVALPVTEEDRPIGVITLAAVQAVAPDRRGDVTAGSVAIPTPSLSPSDDAAKAMRMLGERDLPQLSVTEDSRLVGVVSRDDIARGLMLNELEASQLRHAGWQGWRRRDAPS
jgi:Zn-dependent protease/predicted transcriptional regulator